MPSFQVNSEVKLYYETLGTGQPLLLIHGFMGTGATEFPALRSWLAQRYQVITPDLRGYGQSSPKPRPFDADFYLHDAEDLAALLAHLNLYNVAVAGYSDGGEVALWLPILVSQRVKSVVTWGATGHFDSSIKGAVLSMLNQNWRNPTMDHLHGAEHIQPMTTAWVHAMLSIIERGGDITYSRANEIGCPTLIMLGDQDDLNPVVRGRAMAEAIPQGKFIAFKRTGHAIHTERPFWFRWHVGRFLQKPR